MSETLKSLKGLLKYLVKNSSRVFIVGHKEPDFDSIGSSIGLQVLCTALGKEAYIVIDDPSIGLDPGVKKIRDASYQKHKMISPEEFPQLWDRNSLLIMTDVNKKNMTPIDEYLDSFKNVLILDHHEEDSKTVETPYKLINPRISSASEIVGQLLHVFKVKYGEDVANYLLAGIVLDTKRYKKNTTENTHDVATKLMTNGATTDYINDLFLEEFDDDRRICDLVFNGTFFKKYENMLFQNHQVSFTLNREAPNTVYRKEDIAKASDKMLKYPVDAAFVMGYLKDGSIGISARGKNHIDVGQVMSRIHGGGNKQNAGGRVVSDDIAQVESELIAIVSDYIEQLDKIEAEKPVQKIKLPIE